MKAFNKEQYWEKKGEKRENCPKKIWKKDRPLLISKSQCLTSKETTTKQQKKKPQQKSSILFSFVVLILSIAEESFLLRFLWR